MVDDSQLIWYHDKPFRRYSYTAPSGIVYIDSNCYGVVFTSYNKLILPDKYLGIYPNLISAQIAAETYISSLMHQ